MNNYADPPIYRPPFDDDCDCDCDSIEIKIECVDIEGTQLEVETPKESILLRINELLKREVEILEGQLKKEQESKRQWKEIAIKLSEEFIHEH